MEKFKEKPVAFSIQYVIDTINIYNYGLETFGEAQAKKYEAFIDKITSNLVKVIGCIPNADIYPLKAEFTETLSLSLI